MKIGIAVYLLVCLSWGARTQASVSLDNCGGDSTDRYAEIVEDQPDNKFTCSGIDGVAIEWKLNQFSGGICPAPVTNTGKEHCNTWSILLPEVFKPSRTTSSNSTLSINLQKIAKSVDLTNASLYCVETNNANANSDSCPVDLIQPATGTCTAQLDTSCFSLNVTLSCDISGGRSVRNRYGCHFFYQVGGDSDTELADWKPLTPSSFPMNESAPCSVTSPLNKTLEGQYRFRVMLLPGRKIVPASIISGEATFTFIENNTSQGTEGAQSTKVSQTTPESSTSSCSGAVAGLSAALGIMVGVVVGIALWMRFRPSTGREPTRPAPQPMPRRNRENQEMSAMQAPVKAPRGAYDGLDSGDMRAGQHYSTTRSGGQGRWEQAKPMVGYRNDRNDVPQHDENEYEITY